MEKLDLSISEKKEQTVKISSPRIIGNTIKDIKAPQMLQMPTINGPNKLLLPNTQNKLMQVGRKIQQE